ncbi:MAG: ATP-dependent DNA helicase [Gemmatimonadetes bacterium]|nr:ATP-dependent DNA helicase [Gemmatimonadota bacterium]
MSSFEFDPKHDPENPFDFGVRPKQGGDPTEGFADRLNEAQLDAVTAGDGPALVIAGAGTGKTRVLVHRVAYLVRRGVAPSAILLLTFTRRAASEMLRRASALVDRPVDEVSGGTFHSFANTLLRRHGKVLGLPPNFTILDSADSSDIIGHIRTGLGVGGRGQRFPQRRTCQSIISAAINRNVELADVVLERWPHFAHHTEDLQRIYEGYRDFKVERGLADYDDLLLYARDLLDREVAVRDEIGRRYEHILVDEYQDTNRIQGDLVSLLGQSHHNVMVVGDDAQSIYRFRGATIDNIFDFPKLFSDSRRITLEQSYRSTQPVLDVANEILSRAEHGYEKHLFSSIEGDERPRLIACENESVQTRWIADRILELHEEGLPLGGIAVLFRSSFHAFDLELELGRREIPFVKYGGFKFMETAHVKDIVAHLRILDNPKDAVSWTRVLTLLPGIGEVTAHRIASSLDEKSPFDLSRAKAQKRAKNALTRLSDLLNRFRDTFPGPARAIEELIEYYEPLLTEKYDDHPKRRAELEHVAVLAGKHKSLRSLLDDFAIEPPNRATDKGAPALDSDGESKLILSTIHSAKGLEWDAVFVIWVVEGRFPTFQAIDREEELEEERRLIYVATTRARQELTFTYPSGSWDKMGRYLSAPSRFVSQIPADVLEPWRATSTGLGLNDEVDLSPMIIPEATGLLGHDHGIDDVEWTEESRSRLRSRRKKIDSRILGDLGNDDWTYEEEWPD